MKYTIQLDDEQQYLRLLQLARQAGIAVQDAALTLPVPVLPDVSKMSREELLAVIDQGGDGMSIPDPVAWQREQRQERPLPFRP
jgi:hypothetical protein